jgi:DNA-binding response OmpR family regulator
MSKVIIIDDDPDIIEASTVILKSKGYEVLSASNISDGYNAVKAENPDLIILDVMMTDPDDGFFLAQKFRKEGISTPIIMYTSISKAVGFKFGINEMVPVNDFVEKPVSPEVLISKVEALLHQKVEE